MRTRLVRITRLDIAAVRSITEARLEPAAGVNLLVGENGAGKTSVLEAIHLLGYGRSFRGRVRDGLVRLGQEALEIFVEWDEQRADHAPHRRKAGKGDPRPSQGTGGTGTALRDA